MLKKLLGKKTPAPQVEVPGKLTSAISNSILGEVGSRSIPPMPGAAQKAFQLSTDPSAEARDFVEVIESDEALSARVLKIANSVYFERGKKSESIEDSVLVIGINELKSLLSATTLSDIFPTSHIARAALWAHDIATALTAKALARRLMPGKEEFAFLGGLMHDIGKLLLLQRTCDKYNKVMSAVSERGIDFCEAEQEHFPFDHTQVGQLIAERWNFSPDLTAIIRNHHQKCSETRIITLPIIVHAADTVAHALALGHTKGMHKLEKASQEALPEIWQQLGIPKEDQKTILDQAKRTFEVEYDLYANKH